VRNPWLRIWTLVSVGIGALGLGALAGCSWTFDDSAPDVPLLGDAVPPERFAKLNTDPARDAFQVSDSHGNPWVAMPSAAPLVLIDPPPPQHDTVTLLRLDANAPTDGRERKVVTADHTYISSHFVYLVDPPTGAAKDDPMAVTHVTAVPVGYDDPAQMYTFPNGLEYFLASSTDQAFVYWVPKAVDPRLFVSRTDGSYQRALAPPRGYDSATMSQQLRLFFDRSGDRLFVQDGTQRIQVYTTTSEAVLDLGVQPTAYVLDSDQSHLVCCSDAGLKRVATDGSGEQVLDAAACTADILRVSGGAVYYLREAALWRAPLDGSAPPRQVVAAPVGQLLALGPAGVPLYSRDSSVTYGAGIGDGWLGDWQFMQRGRRPGFSADKTRLRWLENAARSDGSGDLDSATVADRAVLHLARNVRTTAELRDGRVLAISNAAFKGTQNRLIAIDEASRTAQWVVDSARDFLFIPGTQDLLVKIVVGQLGYDIRRVPIPPRPGS
jgi:hypothetical protein